MMEKPCIIPSEEYCDVFTVDEFEEAMENGEFVEDDGVGYFANSEFYDAKSSCWWAAPSWATHVVWFNK